MNIRTIWSVREKSSKGYEIINSGYVTNISLENIINDFEDKLFNLVTEIKTQKLFSSAELLNDIFIDLKDKFLNQRIIN